MNLDVLHEHLTQASAVLDAGIGAKRLSCTDLRALMAVALDLVLAVHNESIDSSSTPPTCEEVQS
jgi:hypothetical protein